MGERGDKHRGRILAKESLPGAARFAMAEMEMGLDMFSGELEER